MFGKEKFYSLKKILSYDCQYNIIFGERSIGKTYAALMHGLQNYVDKGEKFAYIRRWKEDFIGKRGTTLFDGLINNNEVDKLTNGEYNNIFYKSGRWYLCKMEDGEKVHIQEEPFCYGFSIASSEHDKSTSYPDVTTIIFDEFMTRKFYLPDEFILFMNLLSTIIRQRNNVQIFMLANTVSKYCPYFSEMGINHFKQMKQGDIDIYNYGESSLKLAVEFCKHKKDGKKSDVYFAFDNPKLSMITGGVWEVDIYPHLPHKYTPKDILLTYFIQFNGDLLQCEIINKNGDIFTFVHPKTSEIKDLNAIIYTTDDSPQERYKKYITRPRTKAERIIYEFFLRNKVFYSSNEVGEMVRNYLVFCGKV